MARRRKRSEPSGALDTYRRIRKPMPPPERIISDKRREAAERAARREIADEREEHASS